MKKLFFLGLVFFSFLSCSKKESDGFLANISGTVHIKSGCFEKSWLVAIDNPDPDKYSFICDDPVLAGTAYNCSNAVFISNLPDHLAVAGKRIRFSVKSIQQYSCLSYNLAPYHIEARKVYAIP